MYQLFESSITINTCKQDWLIEVHAPLSHRHRMLLHRKHTLILWCILASCIATVLSVYHIISLVTHASVYRPHFIMNNFHICTLYSISIIVSFWLAYVFQVIFPDIAILHCMVCHQHCIVIVMNTSHRNTEYASCNCQSCHMYVPKPCEDYYIHILIY